MEQSELSRRVFVSHASDDKLSHIRPLAQALIVEGVALWLDRPGFGESHFNFTQKFISTHGIEGLNSGAAWDQQILDAHRKAGAVLFCLSRAFSRRRKVLLDELKFAAYTNKLVACIVDDLPFGQLPSEPGLIDVDRLQARRVDTALLQKAVDDLDSSPGKTPDEFAPEVFAAWQVVRELVSDIDQILAANGIRRFSDAERKKLHETLLRVPIGPGVRYDEIPVQIVQMFADRLRGVTAANHFRLAMQAIRECNPERFTDEQISISPGEVLPPDGRSMEYWTDVLLTAGNKSRRTLAALLYAPGAPDPDQLPAASAKILRDFQAWLGNPNSTHPQ